MVKPLLDHLIFDMLLILNRSSVGLSESLQREHNDIALHDHFQTIWIQCVIHAAYLCL